MLCLEAFVQVIFKILSLGNHWSKLGYEILLWISTIIPSSYGNKAYELFALGSQVCTTEELYGVLVMNDG